MSKSLVISENIASLERQIDAANKRADEAYENFDIDGYEGACKTGNRLHSELQELKIKLSIPKQGYNAYGQDDYPYLDKDGK